MIKLPSEWVDNNRYNYTRNFELTFIFNIAIISASILVAFFILLIAKLCLARKTKKDAIRQSILSEQSSRTSVAEGAEPSPKKNEGVSNSKPLKVVSFLASFLFYSFWISASLFYVNSYMFGSLGRSTPLDVLSVFIVFLAVGIPTLIWKHVTKSRPWSQMRKEVVILVVLLVLWLAASVFLIVLAKGGCVCFYNNKYGIKIDDDVEISTEFTRINSIGVPCPAGQVCHLYATVPQDTSTSVFFNVHAGIQIQNLIFTLKLNNTQVASKNVSTLFKMDNVETIGQRNIFSVLFTNLTPNTLYKIEVANKAGVLKSANYKTVPDAEATELRMAVGGDLGVSYNGDTVTSYLTQFNPDIIIIGGDIAYDDAMRSCYYSWDTVYALFEPVYQQLNRLVPIVFSVGNHDVGFDALTPNQIQTSAEGLPLFFVFNPQHLAHSQQAVPGVYQRDTAHYHKIGPTIHFILDSGYLKSYKEQTSFIQLYAQNNPNLYRFANYHNPIYPACTNSNPGSNDRLVIENGLKYWTPLFDSLNFVASMEHHTHFRKITYKIKNDSVSTQGTRYLGDGSWGVTEIFCTDSRLTPRPELMQNYARANPNHMWQIKMTRKDNPKKQYTINYKAVNLQNVTVFQTTEDLAELV